MRSLEVQVNLPFQAELIKDLYADPEDLLLACPMARVPFCEEQWTSFFPSECGHTSLIFKQKGISIGHLALVVKEEDIFLCYVVLLKSHRGLGLAEQMIQEAEEFCRINYGHEVLQLNVKIKNLQAVNLYQKMGYEIVQETSGNYRMSKKLKN